MNPGQSTTIGFNDSYHNLASPVRVKQNLCPFATSGKLWVSIQSFVLKRWASAPSSGLPEDFGLKYDQFNWGLLGCTGTCAVCYWTCIESSGGAGGCSRGEDGCSRGAGSVAGSTGEGCT